MLIHKAGVSVDRSSVLCSKTAYGFSTATGGQENLGGRKDLNIL